MTEPAPRCFCCESLLRADGHCYLCDGPDTVRCSPPHECFRSGRTFTDEHGCKPEKPKQTDCE